MKRSPSFLYNVLDTNKLPEHFRGIFGILKDMNNIKVEVYKKNSRVLNEVAEKYNGAEDFINNRTAEICSQEKLSAKKVIHFFDGFLQFMFPC